MPVSKHEMFLNELQAPLRAYENNISPHHRKPTAQQDDCSSDCRSGTIQELEKKLDILFGSLDDD